MCFDTVTREQEEGGGTQEKLIRIRKKMHSVLILY